LEECIKRQAQYPEPRQAQALVLTDMPTDLHARLMDGLEVDVVAVVAVVNFHDSLPLMWLLGSTSP
jgi:hypothetical protein